MRVQFLGSRPMSMASQIPEPGAKASGAPYTHNPQHLMPGAPSRSLATMAPPARPTPRPPSRQENRRIDGLRTAHGERSAPSPIAGGGRAGRRLDGVPEPAGSDGSVLPLARHPTRIDGGGPAPFPVADGSCPRVSRRAREGARRNLRSTRPLPDRERGLARVAVLASSASLPPRRSGTMPGGGHELESPPRSSRGPAAHPGDASSRRSSRPTSGEAGGPGQVQLCGGKWLVGSRRVEGAAPRFRGLRGLRPALPARPPRPDVPGGWGAPHAG